MRKTILLTLFICALSGGVFGQAKRFKVSLMILGDKDLAEDARSYIGRELRSLGDVDVVGDDEDVGDFMLTVTIVKGGVGNKLPGYTMSINVLATIHCGGNAYFNFITTRLFTTEISEQRRMFQEVGTVFDTYALEPRRKLKN